MASNNRIKAQKKLRKVIQEVKLRKTLRSLDKLSEHLKEARKAKK